MNSRYKFYREHKYVCFAINELERLIARTDFRDNAALQHVKEEFEELMEMLRAHAAYEDERLHALLKAKGSMIYMHAEEEHKEYDIIIYELRSMLNKIAESEARIEQGYQFYLQFRHFAGINLLHLHEEETKILPELQRLYTDDELKLVERETYKQMSVEDLQHMLEVLFPHMNPSDKEAFLSDIKETDTEKYAHLMMTFAPTGSFV